MTPDPTEPAGTPSDVIEPASSGRATCRGCREKIAKGELRFGERLPSNFGDGDQTFWFHLACAAERRPVKVAAALTAFEGEVPGRAELEPIVDAGVKNPGLATILRAERAPTGRASCQVCREKIDKDALRVAFERDNEGTMPTAAYVHLACAPKLVAPAGLAGKLRRTSKELSPEELAAIDEIEAVPFV